MRSRPLLLAALSVLGAASASLLWVLAALTSTGERVDHAVFSAFTDAGGESFKPRIEGITLLADPLPLVLGGLALTCVALLRRRGALAAAVPVILLCANATTQGLKDAIPRLVERTGIDPGYDMAWPSGHATASMSLALCAVLVAGPRLRPAAAMLGAGYAVAVGYALVALGSHLPSDVLGGYLVAGSYAVLGAAVLSRVEARGPHDAVTTAGRRVPIALPLVAPAAGALAVVAGAAGAGLTRGSASWGLAQHAPEMAAGASIAALGVAVIAGLAAVLRSEAGAASAPPGGRLRRRTTG